MTCQQARGLQHAHADGDLDVVRVMEMEEHLRHCPACLRATANIGNLKSAFKSEGLYHKASPQLEKQVRALVRAEARQASGWGPFRWSWLKLAIPIGAAGALATLVLMITLHAPPSGQQLVQEITSSHVRSLMASHLTDVASSDQHTVKPWFSGKLDFSPRVQDLSDRGFPLVGGRLDYLANRPVAALVYERRKHVINLFVWPATGGNAGGAPELTTRQGYSLVRWNQGGMMHWAISDLNARELTDFVQLIRSGR
jgi:anti-sigma factor RsiW